MRKKRRRYKKKGKNVVERFFGMLFSSLERGFIVVVICLFSLCGVLGTTINLTYNGEKAKEKLSVWERGLKNASKVVGEGVKIAKMF